MENLTSLAVFYVAVAGFAAALIILADKHRPRT